jgi:diadenosine tetraphosphate (Ap4A) HIT family hydrolase
MLIVPKRHAATFFDLTSAEKRDMNSLVYECKNYLDNLYKPDGYNIGCNCGIAAGQSISHCHCHLIPRYTGDTENPRGGIRGVIPERQNY